MKEREYKIEVCHLGCQKCGVGRTWDIVDPDGYCGGTTYGDREEAEEICGMLNKALTKGREVKPKMAMKGKGKKAKKKGCS